MLLRPHLPRRLRCGGLLLLIALGYWLFTSPPALANSPPPDLPCRGCHGDNQRALTLPSGETVPLLVELEKLNNSAHSYLVTTPVSCHDCHTGAARYRYPHAPQAAETRHDFTAMAEQSCQGCHYPHNPFHTEIEASPGVTLPTCINCHGSHTVTPLATIATVMPANCIACHTGESADWAAELLKPRLGLGQGATGYAGSGRCRGCHADLYRSWQATTHARMIQDPVQDPSAVVGDFSQTDPDLTFGLKDVVYTIGSRWKQQYITKTVEGKFHILPAQWNVAAQEWVSYHPESWQQTEWREACAGCHVTGLDTASGEFTELGVGCESCHGPSEEHIANPKKVKPYAQVDDQVCGACHSRGSSPDGHPYPATYRPGDVLTDHFTFTTDAAHIWPDGSAKTHEQQYMDWQLGSKMAQAENTNCVSCHVVHDSGIRPAQLKAPVNALCTECHSDKQVLLQHTPYHEQASQQHAFVCTDCHMPKLATSATPFDIHNHSFLQPNAQGSLDHGGLAAMPNACNGCHTTAAEDASWAARTIAYVKQQGIVGRENFFGPGPTPTSPPPPTAIPSVGQPPVDLRIETGRWLRNLIYSVAGVLALIILLVIYRSLRARRVAHV